LGTIKTTGSLFMSGALALVLLSGGNAMAQEQVQNTGQIMMPTAPLNPAQQQVPPQNYDGTIAQNPDADRGNLSRVRGAVPRTEPPAVAQLPLMEAGDAAAPDMRIRPLSQQELEAQVLQRKQFQEEQAREKAFDAALTGLIPLRSEEIREFIRTYEDRLEATNAPIEPLPEPEIKVETISLDPGEKPPVIYTALGHVTTITMLDLTGEPWGIQDVSWAGDFQVTTPEPNGHVMRVTPLKAHGFGNISLRMVGLKTPITFSLLTQKEKVYYRYDARIPQLGPGAAPPIMESASLTSAQAGDSILTGLLDGVMPPNAKRLKVEGADGRTSVYDLGGQTYIRTPLTLLSPGWSASVRSSDGMHVYAVGEAPVILLSDSGKMIRALVKKGESSDGE